MKHDPMLYILHILEEIELTEEFISGGKKIFLNDRKTYYAVLRSLHTLAESAQRLPDRIKSKHSKIPWQEIAGFRNVLVHDYLEGYDGERIWQTVRRDLPLLKKALLKECPNWKALKKKGKR